MKFLTISSCVIACLLCFRAQGQNGPGWFPPASVGTEFGITGAASALVSAPPGGGGFQPASEPGNWADELTAEIRALARGLLNDPLRIFSYVRSHIGYEHYYGSKKGAQLTLLERCGNDFDQSSLLVALLRAAGYQAHYQYGFVRIPYESPDRHDMINWWGLAPAAYTNRTLQSLGFGMTNFPGATSEQQIKNFLLAEAVSRANGWPSFIIDSGYEGCWLPRTWVVADLGAEQQWLDPSFKIYDTVVHTNFDALLGYTRTTLLSQAGGTSNANYV